MAPEPTPTRPEPTTPTREEVEPSADAALNDCAGLTEADIKCMARWIKQRLTNEPAPTLRCVECKREYREADACWDHIFTRWLCPVDRQLCVKMDVMPEPAASVPDAHLGLLDDMEHEAKYRRPIQALGAAISRRDWHAVEQAHATIRDQQSAASVPVPSPTRDAVIELIERADEQDNTASELADAILALQAGQREATAQALSQAYYLITGKSPPWSDTFGHAEAIAEIDDAQRLLRLRIRVLERVMLAAERVQDASGAGMDPALNGLFEALSGARKS